MAKVNLLNGLEKIIGKVEALPAGFEFRMDDYYSCVIGQTVGWPDTYGNKEIDLLRRVFGIKRTNPNAAYFGWSASKYFPERTWKVIRLFTTDIGNRVTREEWLERAKDVADHLKVSSK